MSIDELPLTTGLINVLKRKGGITHIYQLKMRSDKQLLEIELIGKEQLRCIRKSLELFDKVNSNNKAQADVERINFKEMLLNLRSELIPIKQEINELRTISCEQYRVMQSIQLEKRPEGITREIDKKIPGFSKMVFDLYEKLKEKE